MNKPSKSSFKICACGRSYADRLAWETLPDAKTYERNDGALCEQRRCLCGSHLTVELVPAMSVEELRRAARLVEMMNGSFNEQYTAQELLRLLRVCWSSGWDVLPDEWSGEQCALALMEGRIPKFEERSSGLHALEVDDCGCRGCRRERRTEAVEIRAHYIHHPDLEPGDEYRSLPAEEQTVAYAGHGEGVIDGEDESCSAEVTP